MTWITRTTNVENNMRKLFATQLKKILKFNWHEFKLFLEVASNVLILFSWDCGAGWRSKTQTKHSFKKIYVLNFIVLRILPCIPFLIPKISIQLTYDFWNYKFLIKNLAKITDSCLVHDLKELRKWAEKCKFISGNL